MGYFAPCGACGHLMRDHLELDLTCGVEGCDCSPLPPWRVAELRGQAAARDFRSNRPPKVGCYTEAQQAALDAALAASRAAVAASLAAAREQIRKRAIREARIEQEQEARELDREAKLSPRSLGRSRSPFPRDYGEVRCSEVSMLREFERRLFK